MVDGAKWQPIGDQFVWACKVCAGRTPQKCHECRCETHPGFAFDPRLYLKLCHDLTDDKYYFDGKRLHNITVGNKLAELEEKLKEAKEERDYWKGLTDKAFREVINMANKLVDSKIKR